MAYLLFKYLRRKSKEMRGNNAAPSTTDEHPLSPEFGPGEEPKPDRPKFLPESERNNAHAMNLVAAQSHEHEALRADAKRSTIWRWKMVLGLMLPNFLASVDVTIVAPAIPTISSHFSMLRSPLQDQRANNPRSSHWKLQLDCGRVYTHLHDFCTGFWSTR